MNRKDLLSIKQLSITDKSCSFYVKKLSEEFILKLEVLMVYACNHNCHDIGFNLKEEYIKHRIHIFSPHEYTQFKYLIESFLKENDLKFTYPNKSLTYDHDNIVISWL